MVARRPWYALASVQQLRLPYSRPVKVILVVKRPLPPLCAAVRHTHVRMPRQFGQQQGSSPPTYLFHLRHHPLPSRALSRVRIAVGPSVTRRRRLPIRKLLCPAFSRPVIPLRVRSSKGPCRPSSFIIPASGGLFRSGNWIGTTVSSHFAQHAHLRPFLGRRVSLSTYPTLIYRSSRTQGRQWPVDVRSVFRRRRR